MNRYRTSVALLVLMNFAGLAIAKPPKYEITSDGIVLENVSVDCPIIYDNDWWTDIPDAVYLWAKASQKKCDLRGNIVSRDMWDWKKGYLYKLEDGLKDCRDLIAKARKSGLENIPDPVSGADEALERPESGRIEDTRFRRSAGSDLIVEEARKASSGKPLLVFCGGPCTTVAAAYLTDPIIADRMVVFQIDGGGYNGNDSWSWHIVEQRCFFVNWARGYFWPQVGQWDAEPFSQLPMNPIGDAIRRYASGGLAKDNQWGDGAWLFWLFDHRCLTQLEVYDNVGLTVPKSGVNRSAMRDEFFRTFAK